MLRSLISGMTAATTVSILVCYRYVSSGQISQGLAPRYRAHMVLEQKAQAQRRTKQDQP